MHQRLLESRNKGVGGGEEVEIHIKTANLTTAQDEDAEGSPAFKAALIRVELSGLTNRDGATLKGSWFRGAACHVQLKLCREQKDQSAQRYD